MKKTIKTKDVSYANQLQKEGWVLVAQKPNGGEPIYILKK